jgi:ABC-2 type transport system ATP-binding protein
MRARPASQSLAQRARIVLALDAEQTTAKVLAEVAAHAEVRDLTAEEPGIEDVVRRVYAAARPAKAATGTAATTKTYPA